MLIGICGLMGSGKTLLMTILSYIFHKKTGLKVLTNYECTFSEKFNPFELIDFPDLNNVIMCITEAYTIFDSRVNDNASRNGSYYFFQSRKRNVYVFYDAQLLSSIDCRINGVSDALIYCEDIVRDGKTYFVYQWYIREQPIGQPMILPKDKAERFFDKYNTLEIVFPMQLLGEHNVSYDDILELYNMCTTKTSFTGLIRSEYRNITIEVANTVYDMIQGNHHDKAKKVLGIRENKDEKE